MKTRELLVASSLFVVGLGACLEDLPAEPAEPPTTLDITLSLGAAGEYLGWASIIVESKDTGVETMLEAPSREGGALRDEYHLSLPCVPGDTYRLFVFASGGRYCGQFYELERQVVCVAGERTAVPFAKSELALGPWGECAFWGGNDGLFCSGKVDGEYELLSDRDGERRPAAFAGTYCTSPDERELFVYASDAHVTCGAASFTFPVAGAPIGDSETAAPPVTRVAKYADISEDIDGTRHYSLSVAFLIDYATFEGGSCRLDWIVVMSEVPFVDGAIPAKGEGNFVGLWFGGALVEDFQLVSDLPGRHG